MTIHYFPDLDRFTITAERIWRLFSYQDTRMLLRGFNLDAKQIKLLLQHSMTLGYFLGRPLVIR